MSIYDDKRVKTKRKTFDGLQWECTYCTYKNNSESFSCEMCSSRKGTSTRKPRLSTAQMEQLKTPNVQINFSPGTSPDSINDDNDSDLTPPASKRFAGDPDTSTPAPRTQRRRRSSRGPPSSPGNGAPSNTSAMPVSDHQTANSSSDEEDSSGGASSDSTPVLQCRTRRPRRLTTRKSQADANASVGRSTRNSCATPLNCDGDSTSASKERLAANDEPRIKAGIKRGRPFKNKSTNDVATRVSANKQESELCEAANTSIKINKSKENLSNKKDDDLKDKISNKNLNNSEEDKKKVTKVKEIKDKLVKENLEDDDDIPCSRISEDCETKSSCSNSNDSKVSQSSEPNPNCSFNIKDALTCFERGISRNVEITVNSVTVIIKEYEPLPNTANYGQPVLT